nr:hypothetical protein [uncultured Lichenicoccus sp.]
MLFNSIVFLIAFLPLALVGFHLGLEAGPAPGGHLADPDVGAVLLRLLERPEFMPAPDPVDRPAILPSSA